MLQEAQKTAGKHASMVDQLLGMAVMTAQATIFTSGQFVVLLLGNSPKGQSLSERRTWPFTEWSKPTTAASAHSSCDTSALSTSAVPMRCLSANPTPVSI